MGKKGILIAAIAVALTITIVSTGSVSAVDKVDLFFLVDGSGSISSSDFELQKEGLAEAIKDSTAQDGRVSVCVIQFSDYARLEVPLTTITSQSVADSISANIMTMRQINGGTNMSGAFDLAVANFPSVPAKRQVIDLSTDGVPNRGYDPMVARDAAVSAGFDEVNTLGVGTEIDETLLRDLVYPQPSTSAPGFYIAAVDYKEFKAKMKEIIKEVRRGPSSGQAAAAGAAASAAVVVWAILNGLSNAGTSTKSRGKGGTAGPHGDSTLSGEGGATQQGPLAKADLEQGPLGESLEVSEELMGELEPFEKQEGRKVGKGGIIGPKEPSSLEVLCPKCGKKNDRKARFCTNCGTSLVRGDR
jgi:uncharacterized protein YegL